MEQNKKTDFISARQLIHRCFSHLFDNLFDLMVKSNYKKIFMYSELFFHF